MKKIFMILSMLCLSISAQSHDEGHGPKLADTGKYGGLVSAVILKQDAKLGGSATLVHKAELVRSSDSTVRLYIYDSRMKPLKATDFALKAQASLASKTKGKWTSTSFELDFKDGFFIGKMPKPISKPYNIDVVLNQKDKELLTAFDNLD